jgi:hypothetical protein
MEQLKRLSEVLKRRYPGEQNNILAEMLALAAEKGKIAYEEIKCDDETKRNLLLLTFKERLLLPTGITNASISLAWEDRTLKAKPGETHEMPNVIQHLILHAKETGEWSPETAVKKYLQEIAEPEADKMLNAFKGIIEEVNNPTRQCTTVKITPETIKKVCQKHNIKINMNKLIVEFKGGGIISPNITNPQKEGTITYEINPSLIGARGFGSSS